VLKPVQIDSNIVFDSRIDSIRSKLDQIKKSIQKETFQHDCPPVQQFTLAQS